MVSCRFRSPLIEPDLRFSRIRLSNRFHAKACGVAARDGGRLSLMTLRSSKTCPAENCRDPRTDLVPTSEDVADTVGDSPVDLAVG